MSKIQHLVTIDPWGLLDVSEYVRSVQLQTVNPGGFWTARLGLTFDLWRMLQLERGWPGGTYQAILLGETLWTGNLGGLDRNGVNVTLLAQGAAFALKDTEAWTVYADSGYGNWDAEDSEQFDADNNNRVYVQTRSGVTYATSDEAGVTYPESGLVLGRDIIRVEATVDVVITSGSWSAELRNAAGTVLAAYTSTTSTTLALTITATTGLRWVLQYTGAGGAGSATARLTDVVVRTLNPTNSEDVYEDVMTTSGIPLNRIDSTTFVFDQAMYQNARLMDVAWDVVALGNGGSSWVGVIYENGADLRAWATDPDWIIDPDYVDAAGVQQNRDDIFNAVRARMPDGYLGAWQTNAASIARYGRREKTLDLPQMSQAQANGLAAVFLYERAEAISGVRLDVGLRAMRADRSVWPAAFIRAGDVVRLRDIVRPFEDFDIRVAETAFDGRVMRIVPEGVANRLETILSGRGIGKGIESSGKMSFRELGL